ncbi:hypothetical protein FHR47_001029 [Xanthomonas arboricola]|uniref:hypothetical protein n=1 Tax=Xanthomonas cannabis TaxID=1885674 RepID=UPI00141BBEB1|nr:hypothetical protein [Xanthomonas cannabis]MBB3800795.1 hypothetical protein [Xanthomonas cannabis]
MTFSIFNKTTNQLSGVVWREKISGDGRCARVSTSSWQAGDAASSFFNTPRANCLVWCPRLDKASIEKNDRDTHDAVVAI